MSREDGRRRTVDTRLRETVRNGRSCGTKHECVARQECPAAAADLEASRHWPSGGPAPGPLPTSYAEPSGAVRFEPGSTRPRLLFSSPAASRVPALWRPGLVGLRAVVLSANRTRTVTGRDEEGVITGYHDRGETDPLGPIPLRGAAEDYCRSA